MDVFHVVPDPSGEVCDFCTSRPIHKVYACRNFIWNKHAIFAHESVGAWAACRVCSELIEADRWSELSDRAFRKFAKKHQVPRYDPALGELRAQFRAIHQLFREHRIKDA